MASRADELREAVRLAVEATLGATGVVQQIHHTMAPGPFEGLVKLLSAPTYASIRFITQLVGAGLDSLLSALAPVLGPGVVGDENDAVVGALNGVVGDMLALRGSSLALATEMRRKNGPLPLDPAALSAALGPATGRLLILVHGSSCTEAAWQQQGQVLSEALGMTWVALRYNSGLHVSTNGKAFAELLERLCQVWPTPVTDITIVAHSMGGLVTRSAAEHAESIGLQWRKKLRAIAFLGTPHHGAPLERIGSWVQVAMGLSRFSAPMEPLARLRSAGVTDLRFGLTRDSEWQGRDRFALQDDPRRDLRLPAGVACFALAAAAADSELARGVGDGLVPVNSALGRHPRADLNLTFTQTALFTALSHLDLMTHRRVTDQLVEWFTSH